MRLLAAILAFALWPTGMAMAKPLPADLARAIDDYNRATVANDVTALSSLMTDDYVLVNSDGSVQDKQSYLADFLVHGFRIEPYAMEQPISRVHGPTALSSWAMRLDWTQDGARQSRKLRIVHWWIRQRGHWKIEYTQLTRAQH